MYLKNLSAAFVVVLLMVVAAPRSVSAATITLDAVSGKVHQNSVQNRWIFSNQPCKVAGFSTELPQGSVTAYDETATYLGSTCWR